MYTRLIVCVFALVGFFYLMPKAFYYGGIWESRVHPQSDVTVEFTNGETKTGVYTHSWSGKYQLTTSDGKTIEFDSFKSMSHPMKERRSDSISILDSWRSLILPALLLSSYLLLVGMVATGLSFERAKKGT